MADKNSQGWKKYFKVADTSGQLSPISGKNQYGLDGYPKNDGTNSVAQADFVFRNYASRLPEVYSGHPNRIERYNQYENMDMDSEINACLDIIAEFSTQLSETNGTPFEVKYNDTPTDHEIGIIKKQLQQWVKLNKLDQRAFKLFRNTIKYGDQIFVRDPETFEKSYFLFRLVLLNALFFFLPKIALYFLHLLALVFYPFYLLNKLHILKVYKNQD